MKTLETQNKNKRVESLSDAKRRSFLRYSMFGVLAVIFGKISKDLFEVSQISKSTSGMKKVNNFNIKESKGELSIRDKDNNEILIIQNT